MSEPEAHKPVSQGGPESETRTTCSLLRARCLLTRMHLSVTLQRMRIASSLRLCSTHESRLSRPGLCRYGSFRCAPDTERELTGRAISPGPRGSARRHFICTVAELGYGARLAGWGPGRLRRLEYEIARAEIVGRDQTLSRHMPRSAHGVSGPGTAWARRSMRRTVGWLRPRSGSRFPSWRTTAPSPT